MEIAHIGELVADIVSGIARTAGDGIGSSGPKDKTVERRSDGTYGEGTGGGIGTGVTIVCVAVFVTTLTVALSFVFSDFARDLVESLRDPAKIAEWKAYLTHALPAPDKHPATIGEAAGSMKSGIDQIGTVLLWLVGAGLVFPILGMPRAIARIRNRALRLILALVAVTAVFGFALWAIRSLGFTA